MFVAPTADMDNDSRYAFACRMGLLVGAAVHWVGAALLVSSHFNSASTWEYSRSVRRLAATVLQTFLTG